MHARPKGNIFLSKLGRRLGLIKRVFIELNKAVPANERGTLLLDFEKILNENIDEGLNVWCEPIGDKSSLRNLRGIEIKS